MRTMPWVLRTHRALHDALLVPANKRTLRQRWLIRFRMNRLSQVISKRYGGMVSPMATLGDNINFGHDLHGVFIAGEAVIGDNVTIYHHVTIGSAVTRGEYPHDAPRIGNNAFIGANATIIGRCNIGEGARIGAGVTLIDTDVAPGEIIVDKGAYSLTRREFVRR